MILRCKVRRKWRIVKGSQGYYLIRRRLFRGDKIECCFGTKAECIIYLSLSCKSTLNSKLLYDLTMKCIDNKRVTLEAPIQSL
jgi:hypothetical protein